METQKCLKSTSRRQLCSSATGGTENGLANQDTTACTDGLASMMANAVLVLGPFPTDFENVVAPVNDPSTYDI